MEILTPLLVEPGDLLRAASRGARRQRPGADAELQSAAAELPGGTESAGVRNNLVQIFTSSNH